MAHMMIWLWSDKSCVLFIFSCISINRHSVSNKEYDFSFVFCIEPISLVWRWLHRHFELRRGLQHTIFIPHRLYTLELKRLKSFFKGVVFLDEEILALFVSSNHEKTSSLRQIPFTSISN